MLAMLGSQANDMPCVIWVKFIIITIMGLIHQAIPSNQCLFFWNDHQTFQVPKMEVLTYISCMDTAYVSKGSFPTPKIAL